MGSQDEFKKINIKNRMCNYFDYTMGIDVINFRDILLNEKNAKIFYFMTFHTKLLLWVQYHCVLGLIK